MTTIVTVLAGFVVGVALVGGIGYLLDAFDWRKHR